ncbi:hypothetical protein ACSMFR_13380 [Listeria aquatica]|uniref:Two component regulator three Y domain-containing protein n=1 Tax=Listeria aquatica TaxID=1494960 RepID=A0A841ZSX3_9LIST|nr:hypothetical protein [Listeria aquatica]MBC1522358.1 hypothetical protein [Listeria aquatica]
MKKRMKKKVEKQTELIQSVEVFLAGDNLQTKCLIAKKEPKTSYSFAFYIYKKGQAEAIAKSKYTPFDTNQVKLSEGGEYRVKVFVKHNETNKITTKISQPIQKTQVSDI